MFISKGSDPQEQRWVLLLATALLLTCVVPGCWGGGCLQSPAVIQRPENGTVLLGDEPTFSCVASCAHHGWWTVNQQTTASFPSECLQENEEFLVETELALNLTLNSSCMNFGKEISIQCSFINENTNKIVPASAFVQVVAIGMVKNVLLTPYALQWDPSEVRSGDPKLVHYNVTIDNSTMVLVVSETTDTTILSFDSTLFTLCNTYSISVVPYRMTSSGTENGIPLQIFRVYPGVLPVANITDVVVTRDTLSAHLTIMFMIPVVFPIVSCESSRPQSAQAVSLLQGISYHEQTIKEGSNQYSLELMEIRMKLEFAILLKNEDQSSTSLSASFNVSTFQVQELKLNFIPSTYQLSILCINAFGINSTCDVIITDAKTKTKICQLTAITGSKIYLCQLPELPERSFLVEAFDEGYELEPAVTTMFTTPRVNYIPTDVSTNEPTKGSSPVASSSGSSVITIATALACLIVGLLFVVILILVIVLVLYQHRSKTQSEVAVGNCATGTVTYVYEPAEENEHEGTPPPPVPLSHPPPFQRNPAYLQVNPRRSLPTESSSNQHEYEIVRLHNPAYQQVSPDTNIPDNRPSITT